MSSKVRIFEVGPRDGLQNEPWVLGLGDKLWLISGLLQAGLTDIEVGAFVRPDLVPQMAETDRVFQALSKGRLKLGKARAWSLVPNQKGLERALASGATHLALFTAATDGFARRNIGMSVKESLSEFESVVRDARTALGTRAHIRGYVSTAFGCPYEGKVAPAKPLRVIEKLAEMGVEQISIGDTIGVATPRDVDRVMAPALASLGEARVAAHFHDTRGTALANALRALELGVRTFDSSAGGLGGCPYAPGASGNLATEDLVYLLQGQGLRTGVDLERLCKVSLELARRLKRPVVSRYLQAYASQCRAASLKKTKRQRRSLRR